MAGKALPHALKDGILAIVRGYPKKAESGIMDRPCRYFGAKDSEVSGGRIRTYDLGYENYEWDSRNPFDFS